jgi:hypothetical protein
VAVADEPIDGGEDPGGERDDDGETHQRVMSAIVDMM